MLSGCPGFQGGSSERDKSACIAAGMIWSNYSILYKLRDMLRIVGYHPQRMDGWNGTVAKIANDPACWHVDPEHLRRIPLPSTSPLSTCVQAWDLAGELGSRCSWMHAADMIVCSDTVRSALSQAPELQSNSYIVLYQA